MDVKLAGKVAIVTGASRGLGRSAAEWLAREGASVVGAARSGGALDELAALYPERIQTVTCDMRDAEQVSLLAEQAVERFGRVDIVVNNAGVAAATSFLEQDWVSWSDVLAINITGPAILAHAAGQYFVRQGSGKIINVASTSGLRGKPGLVAYSASKGALIRFTEALASEWARYGIQVNAIAPGAFATDAQEAVTSSEEVLRQRLRKIPARRMGDVDEFGPLVCYLASPLSDFVTGATYVIDGGEVSKL
jgi:2-deoxy-D-gluconate 3-dehydrogenase